MLKTTIFTAKLVTALSKDYAYTYETNYSQQTGCLNNIAFCTSVYHQIIPFSCFVNGAL